jgi:hypothetical protein
MVFISERAFVAFLCAAAALVSVVNGAVYASDPLTLQDEGAIDASIQRAPSSASRRS